MVSGTEVVVSYDVASLLACVVLGMLTLDPVALTDPCHDGI